MARINGRLLLITTCFATTVLVGCQHGSAAREPSGALAPGASTAERDQNDNATLSIEEFIQRKVSGVVISRSGSNMTVQIRGQTTLGGQNNALVVIDGVAQDSPSALLGLNPQDIERVQVLKDASASIYGVRGANGVLVITLRRQP